MHNSHLIKISFLLWTSPTPANIWTFEHPNLQTFLIPESITFSVRVLLQSLCREFWIKLSRCLLATVILSTHGYYSVNHPVSTAAWYHRNLSIVLNRLSSNSLICCLWAHTLHPLTCVVFTQEISRTVLAGLSPSILHILFTRRNDFESSQELVIIILSMVLYMNNKPLGPVSFLLKCLWNSLCDRLSRRLRICTSSSWEPNVALYVRKTL